MDLENNKIKDFSDLDVWKEAHKLVLEIYKITKDFPILSRDLGLISIETCSVLEEKCKKVRQLINGLIRSIESQK